MFNRTTAYVNLNALEHNIKKVKALAPDSGVLAMVKCDAYGHGASPVAKTLEYEADAFGVMFLKEALELAEAGIKNPIVILTGFFDEKELKLIDEYGFNVSIHNFEQIKILKEAKLNRKLNVWLKIDTGMHRLGFQPHQVEEAYKKIISCDGVEKYIRFMTHFSDADDLESSKTALQIERFKMSLGDLSGELCLANSAAILNWPKTHSTWVRPGIMLYGVSPIREKTGLDLGLKPVMTLASTIITTHNLERGESIGYGSVFKCPKKMRIGTVAIGYGDGYPRSTQNAPVLIDGVRSQILGRVAMDMVGVDLTDLPEAGVGSKVVLWGEGLPIEEFAKFTEEIPYEIFCRLTNRVCYEFV